MNHFDHYPENIQQLIHEYGALTLMALTNRLHQTAECAANICEKQGNAVDWSKHDCVCRLTHSLKARQDEIMALSYLIGQKTTQLEEQAAC